MSRPEGFDVAEVLEQDEWYWDSAGTRFKVIDLSVDERERACARLLRLALPLAQNVYQGLYSYGYPQGEQAQWELERGEAEAEHVTANAENAQEWMKRSPLYRALAGLSDDAPEEISEWQDADPRKKELAELDHAIWQTQETLAYLKERRRRLA